MFGCGGDTAVGRVRLLQRRVDGNSWRGGAGQEGYNLLDFLEHNQVQLLWHPSLSLESPKELAGMIARILAGEQALTLLCVEGSIINGPGGTGCLIRSREDRRETSFERCVTKRTTCLRWAPAPHTAGYRRPRQSTESSGLQWNSDQPGGLLNPEWRSLAGFPF